jgi:hypothetical protein
MGVSFGKKRDRLVDHESQSAVQLFTCQPPRLLINYTALERKFLAAGEKTVWDPRGAIIRVERTPDSTNAAPASRNQSSLKDCACQKRAPGAYFLGVKSAFNPRFCHLKSIKPN